MLYKKAFLFQSVKVFLLVITLLLQKKVFFIEQFNDLINIQILIIVISALFDGGIVYRDADVSLNKITAFSVINFCILFLLLCVCFAIEAISYKYFWILFVVITRPILKPVFQKHEVDSKISIEYIIEYISYLVVILYILLLQKNARVYELICIQNVPYLVYLIYVAIVNKPEWEKELYSFSLFQYTLSNIVMLMVLYLDYFYWLFTKNEIGYLVLRGLMFQGMTSFMPIVHKTIYASKDIKRSKSKLYVKLSFVFLGVVISWYLISSVFLNSVGNNFNIQPGYILVFAIILLIRLYVSLESIWIQRSGQHGERLNLSIIQLFMLILFGLMVGFDLSNSIFLLTSSSLLLLTYLIYNRKYASS